MDLADLFENKLNKRLEESPEILADSEASYELQIGDYTCYLDLKKQRKIYTGEYPDAECQIQIHPSTFEKMIQGKANIPLALATGKIKIKGNPLLFTKLRSLFS